MQKRCPRGACHKSRIRAGRAKPRAEINTPCVSLSLVPVQWAASTAPGSHVVDMTCAFSCAAILPHEPTALSSASTSVTDSNSSLGEIPLAVCGEGVMSGRFITSRPWSSHSVSQRVSPYRHQFRALVYVHRLPAGHTELNPSSRAFAQFERGRPSPPMSRWRLIELHNPP